MPITMRSLNGSDDVASDSSAANMLPPVGSEATLHAGAPTLLLVTVEQALRDGEVGWLVQASGAGYDDTLQVMLTNWAGVQITTAGPPDQLDVPRNNAIFWLTPAEIKELHSSGLGVTVMTQAGGASNTQVVSTQTNKINVSQGVAQPVYESWAPSPASLFSASEGQAEVGPQTKQDFTSYTRNLSDPQPSPGVTPSMTVALQPSSNLRQDSETNAVYGPLITEVDTVRIETGTMPGFEHPQTYAEDQLVTRKRAQQALLPPSGVEALTINGDWSATAPTGGQQTPDRASAASMLAPLPSMPTALLIGSALALGFFFFRSRH